MLKSTVFSFTEAGYGAHLCAGVKEVGIQLRTQHDPHQTDQICQDSEPVGADGPGRVRQQQPPGGPTALGGRPGPPNGDCLHQDGGKNHG